MARTQASERYEVSDGEKRHLIKLINKGEPLPEEYRFLSSPTSARWNWSGTARGEG